MADATRDGLGGYSPDMDGRAHEATYGRFTHFTTVTTLFVVCTVISLALGAVKHAWMTTIVGVILALIATSIGLFSDKLAWRPNAGVAVLLLVLMLLY